MDQQAALARLALCQRLSTQNAAEHKSTFYSYVDVPTKSPTTAIQVKKRVKHNIGSRPASTDLHSHSVNNNVCLPSEAYLLPYRLDVSRPRLEQKMSSEDSESRLSACMSTTSSSAETASIRSDFTTEGQSVPRQDESVPKHRQWKDRRKKKAPTSRFYDRPEISNPILIAFPNEMFQHPSGMPPEPDVMMEGYLMKRSSNAFKTWNRRWFQIKDSKLLYSHRSSDLEQSTVMEDNLMLCLVRPAPPSVDRVGCFELVTPTRSHLLQADSESLCNDWMRALQRTILALHESDDSSAKPSSSYSHSDTSVSSAPKGVSTADSSTTFEQIRRVPGNERCADCGNEQPKWVSINLGVVLCIECSGVHRSLGVQVSKVRSLTMDSIDAELRDVLISLGNTQVNAIYLAHLPLRDVIPPEANDTSNRQIREAWIKAKYVERRFAVPSEERAKITASARQEHLLVRHKSPTGQVGRSSSYADVKTAAEPTSRLPSTELDPGESHALKRLSSCGSDPNINASQVDGLSWPTIVEAARCGDIIVLLRAMAGGLDINSVHDGQSALHVATRNGQTAAVEFLLLNGAKINVLDHRLNTPLHLAALEGNTLQVCQLLKRGADAGLKNADGVTPLDIAVEGKHADIVTLFRVHTMREEFNEEFDNPMNDTVDSVISDITRRAAGANTKSSAGS